jgi:hypothetical protein
MSEKFILLSVNDWWASNNCSFDSMQSHIRGRDNSRKNQPTIKYTSELPEVISKIFPKIVLNDKQLVISVEGNEMILWHPSRFSLPGREKQVVGRSSNSTLSLRASARRDHTVSVTVNDCAPRQSKSRNAIRACPRRGL